MICGYVALIFEEGDKGKIAARAIIAGDPERVETLATLLEEPRKITSKRGFVTYTGGYNGEEVTIANHGIGAPSAAILIEELAAMGTRIFIRYGTTGTLDAGVGLGDFIVARSASHTPGGIYKQYFTCKKARPAPDKALVRNIRNSFRKAGLKFHAGKIFSTDAFYAEDDAFVQKRQAKKEMAVDMETAMLYRLGSLKGLKSASVLIVSDIIAGEKKWLSKDEINTRVLEGARALLNSITSYKE